MTQHEHNLLWVSLICAVVFIIGCSTCISVYGCHLCKKESRQQRQSRKLPEYF